MKPVADVLEGLFPAEAKKRLRQYAVMQRWEQIVGPEVARATRPRGIRGKTLEVGTRTAAWTTELSLLKPQLLVKIEESVPGAGIEDLVFRTGLGDSGGAPAAKLAPQALALEWQEEALSRPERELVQSLLRNTEDPRLQDALRSCAGSVLRMRKWRRRHGWRQCRVCGRQHRPRTETCSGCGRPLVLTGTRRRT